MVQLTCYGGAGEVGGNKILLEAEGSRVFLDFGMSYEKEELFFEFPLLRPACTDDLFKTGILPRLCGLYRNAGLLVTYSQDGTPTVCGQEEERQVDGVLLSHAHMDHYGYLGMLRPDVPVYLSSVTRRLIELRNDIREEWQTRVDLEALVPVEAGVDFSVANLKVRRYDVDHSILGASAFLIQAGERAIAYTGDLRFHGSRSCPCRGATEDENALGYAPGLFSWERRGGHRGVLARLQGLGGRHPPMRGYPHRCAPRRGAGSRTTRVAE